MKITESRVAEIVTAVGDDIYRLKNAFRLAGIEIVPDPEPELPSKPWRLIATDDTVLNVLDASGNVVLRHECHTRSDQRRFEALVSAYNAAGERKRIEVVDQGASFASTRCSRMSVNGSKGSFRNKAEAVGWYVRNHASDLGLEIVES